MTQDPRLLNLDEVEMFDDSIDTFANDQNKIRAILRWLKMKIDELSLDIGSIEIPDPSIILRVIKVVANGIDSDLVAKHDLGTQLVWANVFVDNQPNGIFWTADTHDTVTLHFNSPPASGKEFTVFVIAPSGVIDELPEIHDSRSIPQIVRVKIGVVEYNGGKNTRPIIIDLDRPAPENSWLRFHRYSPRSRQSNRGYRPINIGTNTQPFWMLPIPEGATRVITAPIQELYRPPDLRGALYYNPMKKVPRVSDLFNTTTQGTNVKNGLLNPNISTNPYQQVGFAYMYFSGGEWLPQMTPFFANVCKYKFSVDVRDGEIATNGNRRFRRGALSSETVVLSIKMEHPSPDSQISIRPEKLIAKVE